MALPGMQQKPFLERLSRVRVASRKIGWGVGDEMAELWSALADGSVAGG